jgi:hypothetical protein
MKQAIYLAAFIIFLTRSANAQVLTLAARYDRQKLNAFSLTDINSGSKRKIGKSTKAGLIGMGIGATTAMVGLGIAAANYSGGLDDAHAGNSTNEAIGGYMIAAGGIIVLVSGLISLDGAIADHKHNRHRTTLITPRKNEIGMAYNF